jgi:hypothetical protein
VPPSGHLARQACSTGSAAGVAAKVAICCTAAASVGGAARWEVIVVRANARIGYHGVVSLIQPSNLPTLSVVGKGEVTIFTKH